MHRLILNAVFILLVSFTCATYAQESTALKNTADVKEFNPSKAHEILHQLSIKLSTEKLVTSNLENAVKVLINLQSDAEICVKNGEHNLKEISASLSVISSEGEKSEKLSEERRYLEDKKKSLTDRVSSCRLFILRSQEAIDAFTSTIKKRVTKQLFEQQTKLWENLEKYPNPFLSLYEKFNFSDAWKNSGVYFFSAINLLISLLLFISALIAGYRLRQYASTSLEEKPEEKEEEDFITLFKRSLLIVMKRYSLILIPLFVLSLTFGLITYSAEKTQLLTGILYGFTGYYLYVVLVRFILCPMPQVKSFTQIPEDIAKKSLHRLEVLGILGLAGYFAYILLIPQVLPDELLRLLRSMFFIVFGFSLLNIIWVSNHLPKIHHKFTTLRVSLSLFISASLLVVIFSELLGYHNLSSHVLWGDVLTISLGVVAWLLNKVVFELFDKLNEIKNPWQEKMRYYLTFGRARAIPEIMLLKVLCVFFIWAAYLSLLIRYWSASDTQYIIFIDAFIEGFKITDIEIVPSKIILAVLLFIVLGLTTRIVRSYVRRKIKIVRDPGAQEALATIVGYIGFALAIIFSMLIAGVNFTGIAIIAGALSVGIGFGLQNIVGNFVAGIILLIERPIKVGDRIFVSGQEGRVKRVSIRATRVRTQTNADLIVPNNEIIATTVTNYMFADRFFRVDINIGVAYGSEVELVRDLLLKCADENEHVIKDIESLKPRALFWEHGDSALIFQLRCNISDVNQRYNVQSELNFAINKIFAENNIVVPFPQTDIHIKELPSKDLKKSSE